MKKLSARRIAMKHGETRLGLACHSCSGGMGLGGDVDALPAQFEITCPSCNNTSIYRKDEIQLVTAHKKH
jgi:hypothetical protein